MSSPLRVSYSTLATEALSVWLETGYRIGAVAACRLLHRGLNDSYLVETACGRYVLRVYRAGWRTPDEIAYEIAALEHLGAKGIAVALPVSRRDGAVVDWLPAPEGSRAAVLFTHAPGRELDGSIEDSRRYGRAVASVERATDDFEPAYARFSLDRGHLLTVPLVRGRCREGLLARGGLPRGMLLATTELWDRSSGRAARCGGARDLVARAPRREYRQLKTKLAQRRLLGSPAQGLARVAGETF